MIKKGSPNSRRDFVKTSVLASGAIFSGLPIKAMANNRSNTINELKIGLVGCGGRGTGAAYEALNTSTAVKLVAMGEVFDDRLNSAYQNLKNAFPDQIDVPDTRKFIGFNAYLKVIEHCDIVILATPAPFRPIHFEAAINAGKHAFIEKPLFVDIPGYLKIMETNELAKQKRLSVGVGLQLRFEGGYQEMKDKIAEGAIGDITSLDVYYNVGAPVIFPRQPEQTEMNYQMRNWRYFTWLWGGQLAGQAIHQIDIMNWIMNDYPNTVNGLGGRQAYSGPNQGNTYDHHYAEYEYSNKVKLHVQCRNIDNNWNKSGFHIQGSIGYADDKSQIFNSAGELIWRYRNKEEVFGSSQKCQSHFINSILENNPINQVEYGAKSTLTTIMGRMAIHSGQRLNLEQVLASKKTILPNEFTWDATMPDMPGKDGNYEIPIPGKTEVL
ncbi:MULTISPECIES: Gfo/Idh/MocA family protein [unclassified Arenibacter]|uniref:Gfo/Idh/MocA family protein n=1 Tax=unclassified Arenibacter TaxID=2615047 RepID=UPI000E34A623|nr:MULTISPECIES: Gfo/Idh/MocA family oxidoreductase [unclassified Arenibacter]MCM4163650.1 dehydrogenase [Arenibacter sp. A80]RFT56377.1 gfo/Idh/MocA family oxidoreductase [Arenibacter sp. P308M17]